MSAFDEAAAPLRRIMRDKLGCGDDEIAALMADVRRWADDLEEKGVAIDRELVFTLAVVGYGCETSRRAKTIWQRVASGRRAKVLPMKPEAEPIAAAK
jgi:hypothetical protein